MGKRRGRLPGVLSDGLLVLASFAAASWLWLGVVKKNAGNLASIPNWNATLLLCALAYAGWTLVLLALLGGYRTRGVGSWRAVFFGNSAAVITLTGMLYFFRLVDFSRGVLELYFLISTAALLGKRMVLCRILEVLGTHGYQPRRVLVVGGGALAAEYVNSVAREPRLGIRIEELLAPDAQLPQLLEARIDHAGINEVVLALELSSLELTEQIVRICERNGVKPSVIPFYNAVIPDKPAIENIGTVKLIRLRTTPLEEPGNALAKRLLDIVVSGLLLPLLSPVLLFIAAGVKLTSPGPVLFRQERVGLNRTHFWMWKFRSMRSSGTEDSAWSRAQDERRTAFGAFLRKTSLDELPQLWNVLRGEMSLVGPRPEIPHFVEQFRDTVPKYMLKHQVRPGITGWAQVMGFRGDTSIPERIRRDLWYIENWSLGLDLKILFLTAFGGMINQEKLGGTKHEKHAGYRGDP